MIRTVPQLRVPVRRSGILLGLAMLTLFATRQATASPTLAPDSYAQEMLNLINRERESLGLTPLVTDTAVTYAATGRAMDMAIHGYFDHASPTGRDLLRMLAAAGTGFGIAGENIARSTHGGNEVPDIVHGALMASEGHRENILEPRFRRVGIGVATVDGTFYFAIVFTD